ncbi:MAG: DUF1653 domain-containing protein [Lachnospiraceae bacterium]|nr:DUF1653 domain-containing protein [Lachnospiraceae bacterium]
MGEPIRMPAEGDVYKHFKGNSYRIVTLAEDTETGETLVIYKALYGEGKVFAREVNMFLEEIDKARYPGAAQKHRFELVQEAGACVDPQAAVRPEPVGVEKTAEETVAQPLNVQEAGTICAEEVALAREEADEGALHPMLLQFLDADRYEDRLDLLGLMHSRKILTADMLKTMAISIDLDLAEGDLEDQYEQVKYALVTRRKFETTRLRG